MIERIEENSKREHFPLTRLLPFTHQEVEYIQGTYDFFGLNHYSTYIVTNRKMTYDVPSYWNDMNVDLIQDPNWPSSAAPWLKDVPWGMRKLLAWIKKEYDNPIVYITESGFADEGGLDDSARIHYLKVTLIS